MSKKDYYLPNKEATITEKRFRDLFFVDRQDSFRLTSIVSNLEQVCWMTKKWLPGMSETIIFYRQGKSHGRNVMKDVFRTKNYNDLVDYLFKTNQEWRLQNVAED